MKRALKILGIVLGIPVLLVVLAILALLFVVDPNSLKPEIAKVAKDKTDADLVMKDSLSWRFWPRVGISLGKAGLSLPAEKQPLALIDKASVDVEVMPLFSGKVVIQAVNVIGAELNYIRHANGATNWDPVLKKLASPEEEQSEKIDLRVEQLRVAGSRLRYVDEVQSMSSELSDLSLAVDQMAFDKAFPVKLDFRFRQTLQDKLLDSTHHMASQVLLAKDGSRVQLTGFGLESALSGNLMPAPMKLGIKSDIDANLKDQHHQLKNLSVQLAYEDKALAKPAEVTLKAESLDVPLTTAVISSKGLALNALWPDKKYPQPVQLAYQGDFVFALNESLLKIPAYALSAAGVKVNGALDVALPKTDAAGNATPLKVTGPLDIPAFNPRDVAKQLAITLPATSDAAVLKKVAVKSRVDVSLPQAWLRDVQITLDDSSIKGEAGVQSLTPLMPVARLAIDKINVDRYLPPVSGNNSAATKQTASSAKAGAAAADMILVEVLRSLNADVDLRAGVLTVMSWPIQNFRLAVKAKDGVVNMPDAGGVVFNGKVGLAANVDVRGKTPALTVAPAINGVDVGPLVKFVTGKDLFKGKTAINGKLSMTGNSVDAWKKTASGPLSIKLENGILHGANMTDLVLKEMGKYAVLATALSGKDAATLSAKQNDTEIASLSADSVMAGGVVTQKSINADLRKAKLTGTGSFNLLSQDADYKLQIQLNKDEVGEKYAKYPVPVLCKGNVAAAAKLCRVDSDAVKKIAENLMKDKAGEKLSEKISEKLGGKVSPEQQQAIDALKKKLFGR